MLYAAGDWSDPVPAAVPDEYQNLVDVDIRLLRNSVGRLMVSPTPRGEFSEDYSPVFESRRTLHRH